MTQKYQDGLFYDMGNGQELVYFKSPNEKVRPSGFVTEAEYRQFRANQTSSVDRHPPSTSPNRPSSIRRGSALIV